MTSSVTRLPANSQRLQKCQATDRVEVFFPWQRFADHLKFWKLAQILQNVWQGLAMVVMQDDRLDVVSTGIPADGITIFLL